MCWNSDEIKFNFIRLESASIWRRKQRNYFLRWYHDLRARALRYFKKSWISKFDMEQLCWGYWWGSSLSGLMGSRKLSIKNQVNQAEQNVWVEGFRHHIVPRWFKVSRVDRESNVQWVWKDDACQSGYLLRLVERWQSSWLRCFLWYERKHV